MLARLEAAEPEGCYDDQCYDDQGCYDTSGCRPGIYVRTASGLVCAGCGGDPPALRFAVGSRVECRMHDGTPEAVLSGAQQAGGQGVFLTPEKLLTCFHTILRVRFRGHLSSAPSFWAP